ncbi:diacylglycerol kinase [Zobellella denitrificans]
MKSKYTGLVRIVRAGGYSLQGLKSAYRNEAAFRQECWLVAVLLPLAVWWEVGLVARVLLVGSLVLVLVVELLNSAVEAVVDRIGPEHHELAGRAKDMGSAAVLLTLLLAALTWILVLLDYLA